MFAVIQPRSLTMPRGQQNRLPKEANPSSWFSTDVTFVVGTAATQVSAKSPVQPNQGSDLHSPAEVVLESVLQPGIRFGPFRLIRRLGRGAQGDVWKAQRHEPYLDIVALKVLSPAQAAAYMQEVALKLRNWQQSLDKSLSAMRRQPRTRRETDVEQP